MLQNDIALMFRKLMTYEKIGGFDSAVAAGKVTGLTTVNKFGGGAVQTAERTVWDNMANADYPFKYTNTPMTIVSSSALDTGQTIHVYYVELVGTDWVYKRGVAVTNGLTPVTVKEANDDWTPMPTDASIMIPYRMSNAGTGQGTGSLIGTLTLANGGTTYAQIVNGYNQTLMALFPVATGYSAIVHAVGRSVVGADKSCTFIYSATPEGQCRQAKIVKGLINGSEDNQFDLPYYFPEKTMLEVRAKIDVNSASVTASFDLILIKNEYLEV